MAVGALAAGVPAVTVPAARLRQLVVLYGGAVLVSTVARVFFLLLPTEIILRDQVRAALDRGAATISLPLPPAA